MTNDQKQARSRRVLATLRYLHLEHGLPPEILDFIRRRAGEPPKNPNPTPNMTPAPIATPQGAPLPADPSIPGPAQYFEKATKIVYRWYYWDRMKNSEPFRWLATCYQKPTKREAINLLESRPCFLPGGEFSDLRRRKLVKEVETFTEEPLA